MYNIKIINVFTEYFLANIFKSPLDIIQETNLSPSFRFVLLNYLIKL